MKIDDKLADVSIGVDASVRNALEAIDRGADAIALITDESRKLHGVVTDGDIRRALLKGAQLDSRIFPHAVTQPHVVSPTTTRAAVLDLMRNLRISEIPVVDEAGVLVGLHTLTDIVGRETLTNIAVIMAGGKGTRLGALTKDTPKPLMKVADRTIIEWTILGLVESGITRIYVSVAHLAQKIIDHLGDGKHLGCTIEYIREDPEKPLNTAGALGLLYHDVPDIDGPIIVTNADLMVRYNAADLLRFHTANNAAVTVASKPYVHQVPFGVLEIDASRKISSVVEKPSLEFEINSGIYAVSPETLRRVPYLEPFSMPDLVNACLKNNETVVAFSIDGDWIDVGTPKDLATAKGQ